MFSEVHGVLQLEGRSGRRGLGNMSPLIQQQRVRPSGEGPLSLLLGVQIQCGEQTCFNMAGVDLPLHICACSAPGTCVDLRLGGLTLRSVASWKRPSEMSPGRTREHCGVGSHTYRCTQTRNVNKVPRWFCCGKMLPLDAFSALAT